MLILNEHLSSYDVSVDKNETETETETETSQFITMSFLNRTADLRFGMSFGQAKQMLESIKEALKDE